ncbi:MAG: glucose-1-phosphate cytidylyltransferase [Planctomycetes bacterium]|nr:glucose-1-phosphate cytidylyltransferase [Planctomycetota bacterium]
MKAVILCGGQGTRIRDVSEHIPKPLLPIGERPILWHIMKLLSCQGVNEFILCLGYKGQMIREYFLHYHTYTTDITLDLAHPEKVTCHHNHDESDWKITLADTGLETQTAGRLWKVRKYLEGETNFILTYGDGVADISVSELAQKHAESGKIATLTAVRAPSRFGELHVDDGELLSFDEKPTVSQGYINGGFMMFDNQRLWNDFPSADNAILEKDALCSLAKLNELGAYLHEGFWHCMDSMREYTALNTLWQQGDAPWKNW